VCKCPYLSRREFINGIKIRGGLKVAIYNEVNIIPVEDWAEDIAAT
jgi:hypothetical protein